MKIILSILISMFILSSCTKEEYCECDKEYIVIEKQESLSDITWYKDWKLVWKSVNISYKFDTKVGMVMLEKKDPDKLYTSQVTITVTEEQYNKYNLNDTIE